MSHAQLPPSVSLLAARTGVWNLTSGQVVGLQAHRARELRVMQGRVWITTGNRQVVWVQEVDWPVSGDVVLRGGGVLEVPADTHVVVESWPEAGGLPARFEWVEPIRETDWFTVKAICSWMVGHWARAVKVRKLKSGASPGVLPHMGCGG